MLPEPSMWAFWALLTSHLGTLDSSGSGIREMMGSGSSAILVTPHHGRAFGKSPALPASIS